VAAVDPADVVALCHEGDGIAELIVPLITSIAKSYTRGLGFDEDDAPNAEIAAVITTASARLFANPEQLPYDVGAVSMRGGFNGFNLAELAVLNRYRKRAE
jgi:hypothetical protein